MTGASHTPHSALETTAERQKPRGASAVVRKPRQPSSSPKAAREATITLRGSTAKLISA